MENLNTPEYLNKCREQIIENLRNLQFAPNAPTSSIPDDAFDSSEDEGDMDSRSTLKQKDQRIVPDDELTDSEGEGDGRRNRTSRRRRDKIESLTLDTQNTHIS